MRFGRGSPDDQIGRTAWVEQAVGRLTAEHPQVGESQANGAVESTIKKLKGQMGTSKLFPEKQLEHNIEEDHSRWEWMVEFCTDTVC